MDTAEAPPVRKRKRATRGKRPRSDGEKRIAFTGHSPGMKAMKSGQPCTACQQHHRTKDGHQACNGHKRNTNQTKPCTNPPMEGTSVCRMHGGASPHVQDKARARIAFASAEGEVAELLRACDIPEQHPLDGLLEVVRHSGGMMRLLGSLVAQLNLKPARGAVYQGLYGPNHLGDAQPHVLVTLYEHWANMYARACKLALDANIDERLVRNAEATTGAVYTAIERALTATQLDQETQAKFVMNLGVEFRKLVDPLQGKVVDI